MAQTVGFGRGEMTACVQVQRRLFCHYGSGGRWEESVALQFVGLVLAPWDPILVRITLIPTENPWKDQWG